MPQPRSTQRRLEAAAGGLATTAVQRMEDELPWYRALPAEDRSWVGMVAHAGIAAFIAWHADQDTLPPIAADVFGTAPRELTRSITLQQTLDLVRTTIDVVEQAVPEVAEPDERVEMRAAVLTYSREVAFACAHVYAQAAETRGAWDARLESLVLDAVLRAEADEALRSRVSALGWDEVKDIVVIAGNAPPVRAARRWTPFAGSRPGSVPKRWPLCRDAGSSPSSAMSPTPCRSPVTWPTSGRPARSSSARWFRICTRPDAVPGPRNPGMSRRPPGRMHRVPVTPKNCSPNAHSAATTAPGDSSPTGSTKHSNDVPAPDKP
ncbi:hypothetical protein [Yimella sp. NH-Cas1]|uniref:hypothetical protein n=1 Tax=Yimella sp. NH-Cas1 TaxID=2917726 RepID=UPI001EFB45DC|nr:hypothetical protein [Yimella sp. NH-Cas1]MCG8655034.1 hypothetical protein [Yimella sp. NH-Cas1]